MRRRHCSVAIDWPSIVSITGLIQFERMGGPAAMDLAENFRYAKNNL
jgi:hypothetical protein